MRYSFIFRRANYYFLKISIPLNLGGLPKGGYSWDSFSSFGGVITGRTDFFGTGLLLWGWTSIPFWHKVFPLGFGGITSLLLGPLISFLPFRPFQILGTPNKATK